MAKAKQHLDDYNHNTQEHGAVKALDILMRHLYEEIDTTAKLRRAGTQGAIHAIYREQKAKFNSIRTTLTFLNPYGFDTYLKQYQSDFYKRIKSQEIKTFGRVLS